MSARFSIVTRDLLDGVPYAEARLHAPSEGAAISNFHLLLRLLDEAFGSDEADDLIDRCAWRGVSADRLSQVLSTGIDVEPPTLPFFAQNEIGFSKALEYPSGEWPRLLIGIPRGEIEPSWKEVRPPYDDAELELLRTAFPTEVRLGDSIWFSRFPPGDTGIATPYEVEWGYWIPEPPITPLALLMVHFELSRTTSD